MKSHLLMVVMVVMVVLVVGLLVGGAQGAILGYDPQASDMPAAPWVQQSGKTNCIFTFYGGGTLAGINVSGSDKGWWLMENAGLSDAGYTIDVNVLIDVDTGSYYPFVMNIYDSGELVQMKIGKTEGVVIVQEGGGVRGSNASVGAGDAYHTYRYVRSGQSFAVYMNAEAAPVVSGSLVNNNVLTGYDRVLFGKGDSSAGGTCAMDYLLWNNAEAIQAAPDVVALPEPTTMLLIAVGGCWLRRRRA